MNWEKIPEISEKSIKSLKWQQNPAGFIAENFRNSKKCLVLGRNRYISIPAVGIPAKNIHVEKILVSTTEGLGFENDDSPIGPSNHRQFFSILMHLD